MTLENSLFGTDGIRATYGQEPLTQISIIKIGNSIGKWLSLKNTNNKIAIACDTRLSCSEIFNLLINSLEKYNISIEFLGVIPTPALARYIYANKGITAGLMITASHNNYKDNGIKIFDAKGNKISEAEEKIITEYFYNYIFETNSNNNKNLNCEKYTTSSNASIKYLNSSPISLITDNNNIAVTELIKPKINPNKFNSKLLSSEINSVQLYKNLLKETLELKETSFSKIKIILDLANGSLFRIAPELFKELGAEVIELNNTPNGININENCGAVYPKLLQQKILEFKADLGFAYDGDGDRVIAVNKLGEIKNGDDILALINKHPKFSNYKTIVGTSMTNLGLEKYLSNFNKNLIRTQVGDKYIAQYINSKQTNLTSLNLNNLESLNLDNLNIFGGESSGHILLPIQPITSDALLASLIITQVASLTDFELTSFKKYPNTSLSIKVAKKIPLDSFNIKDILEKNKRLIPNGRIIVRYSGTEPILRIMVEDQDDRLVKYIADNIVTKLKELF